MSKLDVKLKKPGVEEFLNQSDVMTHKDFVSLGLYTYDINQMLERGLIKRVNRGHYQVVKNDKCEKTPSNPSSTSFEEIQTAFEEGNVATLYRCFQNIELNEDAIRNLYPLLLSGLISLKKEIEGLKKVEIVDTEKEEVEENKKDDKMVEIKEETVEESTEEPIEVVEEEPIYQKEKFEDAQEILETEDVYTFEEAEKMYQAYLDAVDFRDYEGAREYLLTYIKQSEQLGICDNRYYNLFGLEKKLYRDHYPKDTLQERYMLENQFRQFIKTKQIEKAENCYQKLLTFENGENPYYDFLLLNLLNEKEEKNSKKSVEIAKRLCENFPTYPKVYYELAYIQLKRRNYWDALSTLSNYFKYDMGENYKGDALAVRCYLYLGQFEEAEKIVDNAERYLKPEILTAFYKQIRITKEKYLPHLENRMDRTTGFVSFKYQEQYAACQDLFEKVDAMAEEDTEEFFNFEKSPYMVQMREVFADSHDVNEVYHYLSSLGLEGNDEMRAKLMASQFFAEERLYSASDKCFKEVERYPEKDAELKEQLRSTQQQIRLIKATNK